MKQTIITKSVWVAYYPITKSGTHLWPTRQPATLTVYDDDSIEIMSVTGIPLLQTSLTQLERINNYLETLQFDAQGNHYVIYFVKPPGFFRLLNWGIFLLTRYYKRAHEAGAPIIQQLFAILRQRGIPFDVEAKQETSGAMRAVVIGLLIGFGLFVLAILAAVIYVKTTPH